MDDLWDPMAQLVALLTVFRDTEGGVNPLDHDKASAMVACEPFIRGSQEETKMLAIAAIGVLYAVLRDTGKLDLIEKIGVSIASDRP